MVSMRIVIARSNGVDPDSRVEKEANALAKAGYNVTILAWDRSANYRLRKGEKALTDAVVKIISFGSKAEFGSGMKILKSYLLFQHRLFWWLLVHRKEYDVAHLCDFDTAFIGIMAAILCRKKVVFDIFDYLSTDAKTFFQRIIKHAEDGIINKADATIICTEERKEQIKDAKPKKLVVIHNTPAIIKMETVDRKSEDNLIRVVYVGILQDYRLIKEMVHAIKSMPDVELHIGGFGKYENYIKGEANTHSNIIFYGKLQYEDALALEQRCDIMTAIYDPRIGNHIFAAPNKFYEGLMLGKPLLMVNGTGMSRYIEKENIGELVDYNEESFTRGLLKLVEIKKEFKSIGERERQLYREQFSWDKMEKRLLKLYMDLK